MIICGSADPFFLFGCSVTTPSASEKDEDKVTNRQLEFEVYRLQKRIEKQEREIRERFATEVFSRCHLASLFFLTIFLNVD